MTIFSIDLASELRAESSKSIYLHRVRVVKIFDDSTLTLDFF